MPRKTRRPMLKINARGAAVSKLQEMLRQLDYTINDRPAFFGADTRDAVMDIQSNNGLRPTGIASLKILAMINRILAGAGESKPKKTNKAKAIVTGTIHHNDGTPVADLTVGVFNRSLKSEQLLAKTTSDHLGQYHIAYTSSEADIDLFVRAYDDKGGELAVSSIHINASEKGDASLLLS